MMERQLSHMVHLIDDLLDVSRIKRGTLELKLSDVSIQSVVDTAIEASKPMIDAGAHTLSISLPKEALVIHGDPTRLSQIVSNLLTNAAKYTLNGGHIAISAQRESNEVVIKVADTGLGIPGDMLDSIFEMFGQVNKHLTRAQGGLGIGLALVRQFVSLHGGTVHAESPGIGKGSVFVVRLPLLPPEETFEESNSLPPPEQAPTMHTRSILIVDDNADGAESLALYLEMLGHKVSTAHTGTDALIAVEKQHPRVIFLDIGLPDISGYEVAQRIRKMPHGNDLYIAAVTGWGTEEDQRKSVDAGCNEHLTKPIDMANVERIVADCNGPGSH
jgi:CheY-like chemotaxis protein